MWTETRCQHTVTLLQVWQPKGYAYLADTNCPVIRASVLYADAYRPGGGPGLVVGSVGTELMAFCKQVLEGAEWEQSNFVRTGPQVECKEHLQQHGQHAMHSVNVWVYWRYCTCCWHNLCFEKWADLDM